MLLKRGKNANPLTVEKERFDKMCANHYKSLQIFTNHYKASFKDYLVMWEKCFPYILRFKTQNIKIHTVYGFNLRE